MLYAIALFFDLIWNEILFFTYKETYVYKLHCIQNLWKIMETIGY